MMNILELLKHEKVEWKKLGEVCEIIRGVRITKKELLTEGYPVVSGGTGYMGYIDKYNREAGTITIAQYGTAGYVNFQRERFWANDVCFSVIPYENVLNKYLYYFLVNKQEYLYEISNRTATPYSISKDKILSIEIPIPSLETQKKIVDILDNFTNYVTQLQSELQLRAKQYTYYRDMLLSEEHLNKITKEIEEDRRIRIENLNDICELKRGKRLVKSELQKEGEFPVYQNSIIPLGYYHECNFDSDKTFIISAGSAGEIIYSDREFWAADDVYVLMTKEKISSKFLYYSLLSKQHVIKSKVRKASVPRLSKEDIEKLLIPLPSLSLQNKIVKILDKFQLMLADTKGLLPEEIAQRQKQYEYYREKLLTFDKYCDSTHARTHVDIV